MTSHQHGPDLNGATAPDPDVEQLSVAWNAIVSGRQPSAEPANHELHMVHRLHAEAAPPAPRPAFKHQLREQIMTASMPVSMPAPSPVTAHVGARSLPALPSQNLASGGVAMPRRVSRWAAIAATITLLLTTGLAAYLSVGRLSPPDEPGTAGAVIAGSPSASPTSDYVNPCPGQPYFPCGPDMRVGFAFVAGSLYPSEAVTGSNVTMLGWQVAPGDTITFDPNDLRVLPGIAIDIVTDGAYRATFSGPAMVTRSKPLGTSSTYPKAGEVVELSKGDAVSFQQGTRVELTNPLTTRLLHFKSIVIHEDLEAYSTEPEGAPPIEGNPGGGAVDITEDGTGTLSVPIAQRPRQEFGIYLTYAQVHPDEPLPTTVGDSSVIMGPVAPKEYEYRGDPVEGEGYIVWDYMPKG